MHICQRETQICFCHICRLLVVWWPVEEYFKAHSTDYKRPLEMLHWDALLHIKKLLGRLSVCEETLGMAHVC